MSSDAEREALFKEMRAAAENPALDDPDDDVFFEALKPLIALMQGPRYRRHHKEAVADPQFREFGERHIDRVARLNSRIQAYRAELREAPDV